MEWLGTVFLYLHISGVILAFGPTIAFPFFAARAAKEPMHGNFVLRVSEFVTQRLVEPGAVFVFLMGVGAIVTRGYNPLAELWLAVSIVLFLIVFAYANLVQARVVRQMIELTSRPAIVTGDHAAITDAPTLAGPGAAAAEGAGMTGPPPEFVQLSKKAAAGGQFMMLAIFVLVALMVFKPNF